MNKLSRTLRRNERGAAAMEFALVAPALILLIIGIAQLGILFMANAGLRNAVAEGARFATLDPRQAITPEERTARIRNRITSSRFGLDPANMSTPTVTYGTSDSANYADISASYTVQLNFIFFSLSPITLTESRRAFIYPSA
ncbi:MAG TPA: TadE/TadG family type IV pilus assembly protein [Allosphingosinicella sp.]|jgi:Flp pilus assembly protein TadG|nr:TadE/TadG family type IV pilus assembly protein [Allosphingosinicella sp.]